MHGTWDELCIAGTRVFSVGRGSKMARADHASMVICPFIWIDWEEKAFLAIS